MLCGFLIDAQYQQIGRICIVTSDNIRCWHAVHVKDVVLWTPERYSTLVPCYRKFTTFNYSECPSRYSREVWCGMRKERSGQLSPRSRTERKVYTFFAIRPLVQTTSSNASKAVPSSKSDWTLSCHRANSVSTKKRYYFRHSF